MNKLGKLFLSVGEGSFRRPTVKEHIKVGLLASKKLVCFNESYLKMMNNAFYFILKALFVLKIFKKPSNKQLKLTYCQISH